MNNNGENFGPDLSRIPRGFVGRDYIMRPGFEDVVRGSKLKNGMVVLYEDPVFRRDPEERHEASAMTLNHILMTSRWCEVTDFVQMRPDLISFVGLYADGTKISRTCNRSLYFYVKN